MHVEEIIRRLQDYWSRRGCAVLQPLDLPVGAGTFHPDTALRALGPEPWHAVYVQPARRPTDGRHGRHPNRLQRYYQLQVVQKPSPDDFQDAYLASLEELGISGGEHDLRFVEDDWKSPTLGAWGLGWEIWCDGMEISQFTYFQEMGGQCCKPVMGEITYGIERLAMHLQDVDDVYQLKWNATLTYSDLHQRNEVEQSAYNYKGPDTEALAAHLAASAQTCRHQLRAGMVLPAYETVLACSHLFNLLDARGCYSADERAAAITRVRQLACQVAAAHVAQPATGLAA